MCPVWTPLSPPPCPGELQSLSDDAMIILQALREAHRKKQEAFLKTRAAPDPSMYYKTIYQESFKQEKCCPSPDPQSPSSEPVASASNTTTLDNGVRVKTERFGHLVTEMQGQRSVAISMPAPQHFDQLQDTHLFAPQASQESISMRDSVKELPMHDEVPYSNTNKHATGIFSNLQLATLRLGLPQDALEGTDAVSSSMPDSPPIDTNDYQELDNAYFNLANVVQKPNSVKLCTQQGISVENIQEQFRESSRKVILEAVPFGSSRDHVSATKGIGQRKSSGRGRDRGTMEGQVATLLGHSSRPPNDQRVTEQCHSLGEVRPQNLGAEIAGKEQEVVSQSASRPTPELKSTIRQAKARKTDPKEHIGHHSHGKPLAHEKTGTNLLSAEMTTSRSLSMPKLCPGKTPTQDEIFSDFSHAALRNKGKVIRDVAKMMATERSQVRDRLACSSEVLLCILYKDGSSQLREPETSPCKRRCIGSHSGEAECLVLAYCQEGDLKNKNNKQESGHGGKIPNDTLDFISIPFDIKQERNIQDWSRETLLHLMGKETIKKICFDAQEMIHALICSYGLDHVTVSSKWLVLDPKVAAWLLDADHPPITFSDLLSKYLPDQSQTRTRSPICHDLLLLGTVMKHLFYSLNEAGLWQLFHDLEMKLCPILAAMEVQGIRVYSQTLEEYAQILQNKTHQIEQDAYKAAGHSFQITSHSQLRHVLFDELQIDKKYQGRRLARTNVLNLKSTSEPVLLKLQSLHPLPKLVLKYRQLLKLKSTYIDGILDCIQDGYIHTSWEQTSAATGRLQSANPNIQNIPKQPVVIEETLMDVEHGSSTVTILARKPFISHNGWSFIAADFQSIELRVLAHLSHDPVLIHSFNKQDCTDIFVELTSQWLGSPAADVTTAEREKTKRIVYSVIYGVGPDKLAETLGISREEAKTFTRSFLSTFRGVSSFTKTAISCCQRHGFVQTIFRRRRLIPNINSSDFYVRSHAERQCVNFVVQGSAADICKLAMIQVVQALSTRPEIKARLVVQIHDELLLEVADQDVDKVKEIVKSAMEGTEFDLSTHIQLQVPLPVSISIGKNWGQLA